jgi:formate-dependent nitrite reductase membrane component NrfD
MWYVLIGAFLIFCWLWYNSGLVKDAIKKKRNNEKLDEEHHNGIFNIILIIICILMGLYAAFH